jgi:predicted nucleotidyltransferase
LKVVGIVAEYNPFHLGHAYQVQKAREQFGEDAIILAVMSGSFVQRGEPAIASKWIRTEEALRCGVDLVIEIPFTFACASADRFAHGAISLMNATGVVTDLYFGSECSDLSALIELSDTLIEDNPTFVAMLRENLQEGHSYARSREMALTSYLYGDGRLTLAKSCDTMLKMPNSILALEYVTALKKTGSTIKPSVLLRVGSGYHDDKIDHPFASATAIRTAIASSFSRVAQSKASNFSVAAIADQLAGKMPAASLAPLLTEWSQGIQPVFPEDFLPEILLSLQSHTTSHLDSIAYMGDQVSRRLKNAVSDLRISPEDDLYQVFRGLSDTRRHAGTRISRSLISLMCGQTASDLRVLSSPEYIRILGFSKRGRYLLKIMRKTATLPRIDKASDFLEHGQNECMARMAELDLLSTNMWNLKAGYAYGAEYERSVINE